MSTDPFPRRSRLPAILLACGLVVGVLTVAGPSGATETPGTPTEGVRYIEPQPEPLPAPEPPTAERVLAETEAVLDRDLGTPARGNATLLLRDLALRSNELSPADRRRAAALFSRPTDGENDPAGDGYTVPEAPPACSDVVCIHYTTTGNDSVDTTDANDNDRPDVVDSALTTATNVHNTYVGAGYRAPKSDGNRGGNGLTDIYMANIGAGGLYGYCTSDEGRRALNTAPWDTWAYCVIDNDYSRSEFPTGTPATNRQVTIAHEYFHAVQFAYDIKEDAWFLEATAAWAEDEVFDSINDNVQYLRSSSMNFPSVPLDSFDYGSWSFIRNLTERFGAKRGGLPSLVLDMMEAADGAAGGRDDYSIQAIARAVGLRGADFREAFARYASANRKPDFYYSESRRQKYPSAGLEGKDWLGPNRPKSPRWINRLDHLTSATYRVRPTKSLRSFEVRARFFVNLPPKYKGSAAIIRFKRKGGGIATRTITLNKRGDGLRQIPFAHAKVKWAEVTVVNASRRYRCDRGTFLSCSGESRDDNLKTVVKAKVVRR